MGKVIINTTPFVCPDNTGTWQATRKKVQADALDILGRPPFKSQPPLNLEIAEQAANDGYTRSLLRYGNETDDVAWAWLLVPSSLHKLCPAIICLPSSSMTPNWGKNAVVGLVGPEQEGQPEDFGVQFVRNGYIALCPDYPCAGQRVLPGLHAYDTSDLDSRFPDWSRVGMGLWDISRAVDVLETMPQVDITNIGITGWSQGGEMSVWGGAFEKRIKTVISVCGWAPWRNKDMSGLTAIYNYPRLLRYSEHDRILSFDMDTVAALIAPKPFLNISGNHDHYLSERTQQELLDAEREILRLYDKLGAAGKFRAVHLDEGHGYSHIALRKSLKWFDKFLRSDTLPD